MKLKIEAENVEALLAKLEGKPIYAKPWHRMLKTATQIVLRKARRNAPVDSGKLQANITHRLDMREVPRFAIVSTDATKKGFRYPFALNASDKFHYRSGPKSEGKKGPRKTKGWFRRALTGTRKQVQELLATAIREIEAAWRT